MRMLRGVSLFYRLIAVSSLATAGMALFAFWVTTWHVAGGGASRPHWELAIALLAGGLAGTLVVVFGVTRVVLRPLAELERSIVAFGEGDTSARARRRTFTDAQLARLTEAFNQMADSLVEKQAKLSEMSSRVIAAQEEELRRLSREIHDDAGQNLTSVLLGLKRLESFGSVEDVRANLPAVRQHVAAALDGLRRLARTLRPSVLDDLGLAAAIRSSVGEFESVTPLRVDLDVAALEGRMPGDTEIVLYRVFQEAMINIARHAQATTARVRASRDGQLLRLLVEDDGQGFDPTSPAPGERGVGLFSMAERLALVGGALQVRSTRGRGTTVIAEVPLHDAA